MSHSHIQYFKILLHRNCWYLGRLYGALTNEMDREQWMSLLANETDREQCTEVCFFCWSLKLYYVALKLLILLHVEFYLNMTLFWLVSSDRVILVSVSRFLVLLLVHALQSHAQVHLTGHGPNGGRNAVRSNLQNRLSPSPSWTRPSPRRRWRLWIWSTRANPRETWGNCPWSPFPRGPDPYIRNRWRSWYGENVLESIESCPIFRRNRNLVGNLEQALSCVRISWWTM